MKRRLLKRTKDDARTGPLDRFKMKLMFLLMKLHFSNG